MQSARFLRIGERPGSVGKRVYVGGVSCPRAIEDIDWVLRAESPVTLCVPPLRPDAMAQFELFVVRIRQAPPPGLELSINDLGALVYCAGAFADTGVPLAAGPLLAGQDTDPRIVGFINGEGQRTRVVQDARGRAATLAYAPPSPALETHWGRPSVLDQVDILRAMGVARVELCGQPAAFGAYDGPLPVSLYTPHIILSVLPCQSCDRCLREDGSAMGSLGGHVVRRARNMVCYTRPMTPPPWVDRVVRFK